jgi:hypothetical protein
MMALVDLDFTEEWEKSVAMPGGGFRRRAADISPK